MIGAGGITENVNHAIKQRDRAFSARDLRRKRSSRDGVSRRGLSCRGVARFVHQSQSGFQYPAYCSEGF
jgi:hypothetical protein